MSRVARILSAGSFFFIGMWLAKDSGGAFLAGGVQETAKDPSMQSTQFAPRAKDTANEAPRDTPLETAPSHAPKSEKQKKSYSEKSPTRFCNGLEKVYAPEYPKEGFYLRYRCQGPIYDEFAEQLHTFVEEERKNHDPLWGKRGIPANQTFLILGSSHLQQVAQ